MRVNRRIAIVALATAAMLPIGVAQAVPNSPGEVVAAVGPDGSQISWQIPDSSTIARSASAAASFDTAAGENGSVSTIITIPDASAPNRYEFPLNLPAGYVAQAQEGGSVTVNNDKGRPVGSFAVPWAKDANGASVPTSLAVEGATLVQNVDFTADTAFPVTADPHYTWGIITGEIFFNKAETADIATGGPYGIGVVCTAVGALTATIGGAICGLAFAPILSTAIHAKNSNQCVKLRVIPNNFPTPTSMLIPSTYTGDYCS